jgi:hypothetical protein
MTTTTKLFRSAAGFVSPYFVADVNGNVIANTLTLTGSRLELTTGSYISYNGSPLITSTALASTITSIPGTLTGLTVGGNVTVQGTLSVSGTGVVTLSPTTTGNINNINIGATTAGTGAFTTLSATTSVNFTTSGSIILAPTGTMTLGTATGTTNMVGTFSHTDNGNITLSPTGVASTVTLKSVLTGSIDNMSIGLTTPAAGKFTNIVLTAPDQTWNSGAARSQAASKRYAENLGLMLTYFGMGQ